MPGGYYYRFGCNYESRGSMTKLEIKKLDKKWREKINERDNGRCVYCGGDGNNAHHIVGRRNRSTRWLLDNGILLCYRDHTFGQGSFHQDPQETMKWFENKYPDRYESILKRKNLILKQTYEEVMGELDNAN